MKTNLSLCVMAVVLFAMSCSPKLSSTTSKSDPPAPVEETIVEFKAAPVTAVPTVPVALPLSLPTDPKIRTGKLANGMTYYIRPNAKPEQRAELRLALKAGAMQEDDDQLGLAHFIEHMAFNGTEHFSKNELVDYLEKVGSRFGPDLNAYTSFDETVYMLQVRTDDKEQFDKGMLILHDWAGGITFDPAEVDKERGVVVSEWRSSLSAQQRMFYQYLPTVYHGSRYAYRLPIGKPHIIENASYETIRRFYNDWYRPELMALFVVGDINPDSVEMQIKKQFGQITNRAAARPKPDNSVPDHEATYIKVVTDDEATNATVEIMYKHDFEQATNTAQYRDRLLQSLYNRMLGRRLSDISKGANPPFAFAFTGYNQDVGMLSTYSSYAMTNATDVRRAYQTLLDENQRVLRHGFTQAEFDREKANIIRQAEQSVLEEEKLESNRMVQRMIGHFLDENPMLSAAQVMELYKGLLPGIKVEEISALAGKWMTEDNRVIVVTAPEKDRPALPDSAELRQILDASAQRDIQPYADVDLSAPIITGTFAPQSIQEYSYDEALQIHSWSLSNGVKVKAKQTDFKNDEILMSAYSKGGHSIYDDTVYPSARAAGSVIGSSGIGTYNATSLEKKLTGTRVSVSPMLFERYEGFNGSSSRKDLELMMQLIYGYGVQFRKDTSSLSAYLSRERTFLTNSMASPDNWFFHKVAKLTSGNHYRRGIPPVESIEQVSMDDIQSIYADRFADFSDMTFFFVGNFGLDTLQQLTAKYLGALPGNGRKENYKDIGDRFPSGVVDSTFNRGAAPKSLVQLIYHGKDVFHPDSSYLLQSLIDIARIKLREAMREDEGGVYGVSIFGSQWEFPESQYSIRISFNAEPERTKELTELCESVLAKLKTEIDPDDIVKITEAQRQGRIKDLKQNQFWMGQLTSSWINNTDLRQAVDQDVLEKRIASLSAPRLQKLAKKYFNSNSLIRARMYPEKS